MKALVVIAEGMDPTLMASEMADGALPWFKQLRERGRHRDLDCGPVPYEPSNLATAFAGVKRCGFRVRGDPSASLQCRGAASRISGRSHIASRPD